MTQPVSMLVDVAYGNCDVIIVDENGSDSAVTLQLGQQILSYQVLSIHHHNKQQLCRYSPLLSIQSCVSEYWYILTLL